MHPILFVVGGETIYAFGTMLLLGLVLAVVLFRFLAKREGLPQGDILTYIVLYFTGVVGSRVLYVITNLAEFDSLDSMMSMRRGGLVGYGGFLGAALGAYLVLRMRKLPFLAVADLAVPCVAALTVLMRIGCYGFGCDFGVPLSEGAPSWLKALGTFPHWPDGMSTGPGAPAWVHHVKAGKLSALAPASLPVHPTQLYEVLLGALVFAAYFGVRKHQRFRGQLFLQFVLVYGACRFALEPLRDGIDDGNIGPVLPEHVLIPLGLAAFAAGFAAWIAPAIEALPIQRVAQGAAFLPALVAFALLRPGSSVEGGTVALSTTQFMALATGLAAAYAFARVRRASLADPAGPMAIALPSTEPRADEIDEEPQPTRKKRRKKAPR